MVDPNAIDPVIIDQAIRQGPSILTNMDNFNLNEVVTEGVDSFTAAFSTRTIGAILGNIAAATFLKYIYDQLWIKFQSLLPRPKPSIPPESLITDQLYSNDFKETRKDPDIPLSGWLTLLLCIIIDLAGDSSFALPGVGEVEDVVWAPISAYILSLTFGSNIVAGLDFVKEILPGSDIIPVAITAWVIKYKYPDSAIAKTLGLQQSPNVDQTRELAQLLSSLKSKSQAKEKSTME